MRLRTALLLWLGSDVLLFIGSYALAYFLRVGWLFSTDFPFDQFLMTTVWMSPLWLCTLASFGAFHPFHNQRTLPSFLHIAAAALLGVALFTLGYYFAFATFFSRFLLILAFVLSSSIVWGWHCIVQGLLRHTLRRSPPRFPTLLIGATREAATLLRTLEERQSPLTPIGILDSRSVKETSIEGIPLLGKLNVLEEILERKHITHLIQCSDLEQTINLLSACRRRGITYMLLPSVLGIIEHDERIESLEGFPVTVVRPHTPWWSSLP